MNPIIENVLIAIVSVGAVFIGRYIKDIYFPKRKLKYFTVHKSMCYLELDRVCSIIKTDVCADRVCIAYFHNGGTFVNGISMDKFTIVGEDYVECLQSYKDTYVATMVNKYPYVFSQLLNKGKYIVEDLSSIDPFQTAFKTDLISRGIKSVYIYLIKDPVREFPLGFVWIESLDIDAENKIDSSYVFKHQNKIARLLNQTYTHGDN